MVDVTGPDCLWAELGFKSSPCHGRAPVNPWKPLGCGGFYGIASGLRAVSRRDVMPQNSSGALPAVEVLPLTGRFVGRTG
jgi:hypothetical protein